MAVHVFVTDSTNYEIIIDRGIVALPEASAENHIFDALLSRIMAVKDNDYILIYISGTNKHELHGVWQADGFPFYSNEPIWPERVYPYRVRIKPSKYCFENPLKLNDINDLRNDGKIWTWALQRASGTNSMFSITNYEFSLLITKFLKLNPFTSQVWRIQTPHPYRECNILEKIHYKNDNPAWESSIMTLLVNAFNQRQFTEIFGNYSDFLSYVPTSLGKEMDFLLMFSSSEMPLKYLSYDIIELKHDIFDIKGLSQLIEYESWFLQKKVAGDQKMLRVSAIARTFSADVKDYVKNRTAIEHKPIKLIEYHIGSNGKINLSVV